MIRGGYDPLVWLGIALIAIGIALVMVPYLAERMPGLEGIPPLLLYVYRRGDFYLATSPVLIAASLIALLAFLLARRA